jgi:RNA recognition motif-containing protein
MSANLYVDGLPASVTEKDVKTLFSTCGTVLSVCIATTIEGPPMGIAQIQMAEAQEAERAIHDLHHTRLDGNLLLVFGDPRIDGAIQSLSSP